MDWSQKTIAKDEGYRRFTQKSMFDICNSCYVDGEQMQSCDLFACQLPSPGLLSLFAIYFFSSALLYTKFRAEF